MNVIEVRAMKAGEAAGKISLNTRKTHGGCNRYNAGI
jgi:hypothetical protein